MPDARRCLTSGISHLAHLPANLVSVLYFSAMAKEEPIQLEGQVTEVLPNATFRVQLTNGHNVLATLGGNMRRFRIRVLQGDRVTIEVSPYDLTRGRIIFRHKT